jgi:hypothetical protein
MPLLTPCYVQSDDDDAANAASACHDRTTTVQDAQTTCHNGTTMTRHDSPTTGRYLLGPVGFNGQLAPVQNHREDDDDSSVTLRRGPHCRETNDATTRMKGTTARRKRKQQYDNENDTMPVPQPHSDNDIDDGPSPLSPHPTTMIPSPLPFLSPSPSPRPFPQREEAITQRARSCAVRIRCCMLLSLSLL